MSKVWFITGCSTGFGRNISTEALQQGNKVAVTSRNPDDVKDIVEKFPDSAIAVKPDVTKPDEIKAAVKQAHDKFGRIDVLVNNAGIGYFATVEESKEAEYRRMFKINFFGLANVTTAVLPIMRAQQSGNIVNISSVGGLVAFPGIGL